VQGERQGRRASARTQATFCAHFRQVILQRDDEELTPRATICAGECSGTALANVAAHDAAPHRT
jgi:hypothetical protein